MEMPTRRPAWRAPARTLKAQATGQALDMAATATSTAHINPMGAQAGPGGRPRALPEPQLATVAAAVAPVPMVEPAAAAVGAAEAVVPMEAVAAVAAPLEEPAAVMLVEAEAEAAMAAAEVVRAMWAARAAVTALRSMQLAAAQVTMVAHTGCPHRAMRAPERLPVALTDGLYWSSLRKGILSHRDRLVH